ncbi:MAG: hypothetical protein WEC14_00230 [Chloroflexota bacterium]
MIEPTAVITAIVVFGLTSTLVTLGAGLRRIPWLFGTVVGMGSGMVLTAAWAANSRLLDPAALVLVGAIGGSLTQAAFDRGERVRRRISGAITATRGREDA